MQRQGRLHFTGSAQAALAGADVAFIAVGTPSGPTGEADLTYVRQAAREIAQYAGGNLLVVNKSTVPVDTADLVERIVRENATAGCSITVASNPEFLREGSAVGDFMHPDRIVIGCNDRNDAELLMRLYAPLGAPVHLVDVHTAEMIKYAANAFLAARISFANEIANLCAAVGADVDGVIAGISADSRIGGGYLNPGLGFGGSCLPKDVNALIHLARTRAVEPTMLEATLSVNRRQVVRAVNLMEELLGDLCDCPIAIAGLAFKGGTDDLRESPALVLVQSLLTRGARITVHDPHALQAARKSLEGSVRYADSAYAAARGVRAFAIASDDRSYAALQWKRIAAVMKGTDVFDLRNRANPRSVRYAGLNYHGVGRTVREALVS